MELFIHLLQMPFWSKLANIHGLLAMAAIFLFGVCFVLYFLTDKIIIATLWLKNSLLILFVDLILLDIAGLSIYVPYRATGGPRSLLLSGEATAWIHKIVFEHKEFLAFAPPILIFAAFSIVKSLDKDFGNKEKYLWLRKSSLAAIILALIYVFIVAGEAVLVTKVVPL